MEGAGAVASLGYSRVAHLPRANSSSEKAAGNCRFFLQVRGVGFRVFLGTADSFSMF